MAMGFFENILSFIHFSLLHFENSELIERMQGKFNECVHLLIVAYTAVCWHITLGCRQLRS